VLNAKNLKNLGDNRLRFVLQGDTGVGCLPVIVTNKIKVIQVDLDSDINQKYYSDQKV
jgi:hypothetical protein